MLAGLLALVLAACAGEAEGPTGTTGPSGPAASGATSVPSTKGPSATSTCVQFVFSWDRTTPSTRSPDGSYSLDLRRCEVLWFQSPSATLDGVALCEPTPGQNCVLLYLANEPVTVNVGVASPGDVGTEFWGVTRAEFAPTIAGWGNRALEAPNCGDGCTSLLIHEYVDGEPVGTRTFPP